ncbi:MAG: MmgE/PrpD family protein [Pseudolabrys sp.]|nr:MmgE/PrpD family protein [Pseudolabrys sp.]MDP2298475.1 MmgE/PrpD family protein [Pseudolabrys sp.]
MNVQTPVPDIAAATDGISRRLCESLVDWSYDDLPTDVVQTIKLFVVDTFGVIGGAAKAPGMAELNRTLSRWETQGSATGLIGKRRYSPPNAALANGAAAHALDFDDMHDPARIHAFCVMLPTMLAAAEDIGKVNGRDFILALAVGAEVHARLGFTCFNSLGKGWHPTMTLGTLAAALGVGRLLGQDAKGLLNTLGLAMHQTCGTAQPMLDGVLAKRLGAGIASRNAVTAAFLANDGITGPFLPLEGKAGLFHLLERDEVRPQELLEDIGREWRTRGYSVKPYPCCRCNHTSIDLAIGLRARGLKPQDVQRVDIGLPQVNFQTVGQPYDVTRDSIVHAQFNAAYSFARALSDGKVDLQTYTRPNITDPAIAALASRVHVASDPNEKPTDMAPSHIVVTTTDGGRIDVSARIVPGSPESPMSEAQVLDKFRGCMAFGMGLGSDAVNGFSDQIMNLEKVDEVATLCASFPTSQ